MILLTALRICDLNLLFRVTKTVLCRRPSTGFKQKKWSMCKFGTKEGKDTQLRSASLDFSFVEAEGNKVLAL